MFVRRLNFCARLYNINFIFFFVLICTDCLSWFYCNRPSVSLLCSVSSELQAYMVENGILLEKLPLLRLEALQNITLRGTWSSTEENDSSGTWIVWYVCIMLNCCIKIDYNFLSVKIMLNELKGNMRMEWGLSYLIMRLFWLDNILICL